MLLNDQNESDAFLAKLLATENITIQYDPNAQTACFDCERRVLSLPVWENISPALKHLLIIHEVGHALYTPPGTVWREAVKALSTKIYGKECYTQAIHGFLNVIEDVRIDRKQKEKFPGCRRDYSIGYKELIERNFFLTAGKDVNTYNLIDKINIYYKGGILAFKMKFTKEEKVFLDKALKTETWEQVVALTEEVFNFCKSQMKVMKDAVQDAVQISLPGPGESDEADEGVELETDFDVHMSGDEGNEDDGDNDEGNKLPACDHAEHGGSEVASGKNHEEEDPSDEEDSDEEDDEEDDEPEEDVEVPESSTNESEESMKKGIASTGGTAFVYPTFPDPNMKTIIHDFPRVLADYEKLIRFKGEKWKKAVWNEFNNFRLKENETTSFMTKEFEMRKQADIYAKVAVAKTGTINPGKLYQYRFTNDIFKRNTLLPDGKNHGFVFFIDWSGSMTGTIKDVARQVLSLVFFCQRVQIPFEVYTFKQVNNGSNCFKQSTSSCNYYFRDFVLRNFLSSRMNAVQLQKAYNYLWMVSQMDMMMYDDMAGTPLNQAIYVADHIVNDFKLRNGVEIVNTIFLTDGCSEPGSLRDNRNYESYKLFYNDPVTKKTYPINNGNMTDMLLRRLKDRTGCNLVGFYLWDSSFTRAYEKFYAGNTDIKLLESVKKSWEENNYFPVSSKGYDTYFIMKPTKLRGDETFEIDDKGGKMSNRKLLKSFIKFSAKKSTNRVFLTQFIKMIAEKTGT